MHITDTNYFPAPNYTAYVSAAKYSVKQNITPSTVEAWINSFTQYLFKTLSPNYTAIPTGYVVSNDDKTLNLGPKVETNDWKDFLDHYWLLAIVIGFLLFLIIIIPFIAVCYCCFCHCRCSNQGCPHCDTEKNARKRCCLSYLLVMLIVALLFGVIISLASNSSLNKAIDRTSTEMSFATKDTCTYLKDISNHIQYVLVNNYEELSVQLIDVLQNAHDNMYYAFLDNAGLGHIYPLCDKLENMPKALPLMKDVTPLIKDLKFYGAQFRDSLRSIKRDIVYALTVLCGNFECLRFLKMSQIETLDISQCLHFDELPDAAKFATAMEHIIVNDGPLGPRTYINRIARTFLKDVKETIEPRKDLAVEDINAGKEVFRLRADKTKAIIDYVIGSIHLSSRRSTNSFDDAVSKFGSARNVISIVVCFILTIIIIFLIIGVICGCCGRDRQPNRTGCCNKGTGVGFLLLAILLIFCVFSFILLVGILYLVIGLLTYQGACAPRRDQQENSLFRYFDKNIDVNRFILRDIDEPPIPPMRLSNVLKAFHANQSMCDILKLSGLYDINELLSVEIIHKHENVPIVPFFHGNKSGQHLSLNPSNTDRFQYLTDNDMMKYESLNFTKHLCKELTPLDLNVLANQVMLVRSTLWTQWGIYDWARISLYTEASNLRQLNDLFSKKITSIMDEIANKLSQIDKLILLNSSYLYGQSVEKLYDCLHDNEPYLWDWSEVHYQNEAIKLPGFMDEFILAYKKKAINDFCTKIGKNAPIESIYNRGADIVCDRLINPLNRYWVGVLFSSLLLIPVLYLAHQLMCVLRIYRTISPIEMDFDGCPVCGGTLQ